MNIKRKKEGIKSLGFIYTLRSNKLISKQDLVKRKGNSTKETVIIYMRGKNGKRKDSILCKIKLSSCTAKTNKTMEINLTPIENKN